MKLDIPKNTNYAAVVVKLTTLVPLTNCDNVVGTPLFGFQAIIGKEHHIGDVGIVFPAETRLSEKFCHENNLFRHAEFNKDTKQTGYIENNRRVKAVKFRGHASNCLFMPLESVKWTGVDIAKLNERDEFDTLNGQLICEKYERPVRLSRQQQKMANVFKRVDKKFLPEHYDSENYFRNESIIPDDTQLIVTQKLHGTSIRIGNTIVLRKQTFKDKIASHFGVAVRESEFDYVYGSRKVIKDVNNPNQNHYYGDDIWSQEGKKIQDLIPQNFIVYAELIGWTPSGAPIQKDYTYDVPEGESALYVYRVAFVNGEGVITDLSWDHVKEFCTQRGLKYVAELWRGLKRDFYPQRYLDMRFCDEDNLGIDNPVILSNAGTVDEGVCVRIDTMVPTIYKAKSPKFLEHETRLIDQGVEDLEAEQSTTVIIEDL